MEQKTLIATVVYPTPPQNKVEEAKGKLKATYKQVHNVDVIAIGNGEYSLLENQKSLLHKC